MSFQLFVYYFSISFFFFFLNYTAPTEISTLSLHDALPIYGDGDAHRADRARSGRAHSAARRRPGALHRLASQSSARPDVRAGAPRAERRRLAVHAARVVVRRAGARARGRAAT